MQIFSVSLSPEERNEFLINFAGAVIYTIQADGTMTYVSANWPRELGHAVEEVVGRSFSDFVHPDDHPACYEFLAGIVKTGEPACGIEYRVIHSNGSLLWHTSNIIPVKQADGEIIGYVGVAHDITRLRETQEKLSAANAHLAALLASREAELQQATQEALCAAESEAMRIGQEIHDSLCQDLIGLSRMAELAMPCHIKDGPSCCEVMIEIRENAARMTQMARTYAHNLTLHELEVQPLPEALETLARRCNLLFHREIETNISDKLDFLTSEQSIHIYRIIREAIANAIKHANAAHIWVDLVLEAHHLAVSVSNDGTPLLDAALRRDGLGMRQMKMRAKLLGGEFTLRNNGRQQTVLELILPLPL